MTNIFSHCHFEGADATEKSHAQLVLLCYTWDFSPANPLKADGFNDIYLCTQGISSRKRGKRGKLRKTVRTAER